MSWCLAKAGKCLAWTPKKSSQGCLFKSAHSEACPCSRLVASAISPQVTSAPSFLQTRLHNHGWTKDPAFLVLHANLC